MINGCSGTTKRLHNTNRQNRQFHDDRHETPRNCPFDSPCRCIYDESVLGGKNILDCKAKGFSSTNRPEKVKDWTDEEPFTTIDFSQNNLQNLQVTIFDDITDTVTLNLKGNSFRRVPVAVQNAKFGPRLQNLILSNNAVNFRLSLRPFRDMKQLRSLNLNNNRIATIGKGIFTGLRQLSYLDLSENGITRMSMDVFSGLDNLTDLFLYGNKLTSLDSFVSLPVLETLDLSQNRISVLSNDGAFSGLSSLRFLDLSNNRLAILTNHQFDTPLPNLQTLRLASNNLNKIENKVFDNMPNLEVLDLSRNIFLHLPNMMHLEHLRELSVINMKISYLYPCNLGSLQNLNRLYLAKNPLQCDCQLKWLKEWYDEKMDETLRKDTEEDPSQFGWKCRKFSNRGRFKRKKTYFHQLASEDFGCIGNDNYTTYCLPEMEATSQQSSEDLSYEETTIAVHTTFSDNSSTSEISIQGGNESLKKEYTTNTQGDMDLSTPSSVVENHGKQNVIHKNTLSTHDTSQISHFHLGITYILLITLTIVILIILLTMVCVFILRKKFKKTNSENRRVDSDTLAPVVSSDILQEDAQNYYEPPPYLDNFNPDNPYTCWGTPYAPSDEHTYQELTCDRPDNGEHEYMQIMQDPDENQASYTALTPPTPERSKVRNDTMESLDEKITINEEEEDLCLKL